jgi:opacity protein-like surface antigen
MVRNIEKASRATRFSWLLGTVFLFGLVGQAFADDTDYQGTFLKLMGGLNFALDSDFDGSNSSSFPSGEANLDTGQIMGIAGGYRFNRNIAAELEYTYRSNDIDKVKNSSGATFIDSGDLASVAIMANGYYYFDIAKSWSQYLGLGIGYLQEIDGDLEFVNGNNQGDLEDEAFGWQAMLGAEVPLNDSWRFYGEGRFMSAPGTELSNSRGSYDVDYENLSLIVGIGYQF